MEQQYIIDPMFIYWLQVIPNIGIFCCTIATILAVSLWYTLVCYRKNRFY
jgi:hypothetical protein